MTDRFNISENRPTEDQINALIAERNPQPKPECERCLYEFSQRRCFNCTVQGGDGTQYAIPFIGWDDK